MISGPFCQKGDRRSLLAGWIIAGILIAGCGQNTSTESKDNRIAPDFVLSSLSGNEVRLADALERKKMVLIAFWATWCPPCVQEISELNRLYEKYSEQIEILAVNVQEDALTLKIFREKHPMHYTVLLDSTGEVTRKYGVAALPVAILLAKEREIIYYGFRLPDVKDYISKTPRNTIEPDKDA